jgi:hypothetical protein
MRVGDVGAVALRFRAELARRRRAWLGLALILGLIGGVVLAMAAGARRTDTAYSRFLDGQNAFDVLIVKDTESFGTEAASGPPLDAGAISALPHVTDVAVARRFFTSTPYNAGVLVSLDGKLGDTINRSKILEGRALAPDNPAEVTVGFAFAEQYGIRVGDEFPLFDPAILDNPPPDTPPEILEAGALATARILAVIPGGTATVVGIEATPGEFPPQIEGTGRYLIHASPALAPVLDDLIAFQSGCDAVAVRLEHGSADIDSFLTALDRSDQRIDAGGGLVIQRDLTANVVRSVHTQANALWLLALLTAIAGLLVGSQLLARLTLVESDDQPVLAVLGMTRRERLALGLARATTIATAAAIVALLVAAATSPLFPTGLADKAEPSPGFRIDTPVIALGGLALVLVVIVLAVWPSWMAARRSLVVPPAGPGRGRRSAVGTLLSVSPGLPLPAEIGARMALESGRGRAAVPVRSTLTVVTLGIAAVAAALVFATSLDHLLSTPRLYGQTWDAELTTYDEFIVSFGVPILQADPRIEGMALGRTRDNFVIDGRRVDGLGIDPVKGGLTPSILEGRAPVADDEIVIGTSTLDDLDLKVGDVAEVGAFAGDGSTVPMRVVGRAVFPVFGEAGQLGDGVYVTRDGDARIDAEAGDLTQSVLVQLAPGADLDTVVADMQQQLEGASVFVIGQGKPTDIVNFGRVKHTPDLLGALLGAVSAMTLLQLLLTTPRRRRRDLAVLKSLGFTRRQVGAAVVWQAVTVLAIALVIGIPVGIAAGLTLWRGFAHGLGVVAETQVNPVAIALIVIGGIAGALLIAVFPSRAAARTPLESALRSE